MHSYSAILQHMLFSAIGGCHTAARCSSPNLQPARQAKSSAAACASTQPPSAARLAVSSACNAPLRSRAQPTAARAVSGLVLRISSACPLCLPAAAWQCLKCPQHLLSLDCTLLSKEDPAARVACRLPLRTCQMFHHVHSFGQVLCNRRQRGRKVHRSICLPDEWRGLQ